MKRAIRIWNVGFVLFLALPMIGCLRTRAEVQEAEQKKQLASQVQLLAQNKADTQAKIEEQEEQIRNLHAKIDEMQSQMGNREKAAQDKVQAAEERNRAYQEAIDKLQMESKNMEAEVSALKEAQIKSATPSGTKSGKSAGKNQKNDPARDDHADGDTGASKGSAKGPNNWVVAEDQFSKKEWKKAILGFQKYRELNPTGKRYASATYKIGVCFQELGMKSEAKVFFEEVAEKYPKSSESKEAKVRLKSLK